MFDINEIKTAASYRWPEIITHFAGEIDFSGKPGPCPKCQGDDRFHFFQDNQGGAFCRHCHTTNNADGFATIQWLTGRMFTDVVREVQSYLGLGDNIKKTRPKKLEFIDWSIQVAQFYCNLNPPITPQALLDCGARIAKYRTFTVFAIPIYDENWESIDHILINFTGQTLPVFDKTGKIVDQTKAKALSKKSGILGNIGQVKSRSSVVKVEGITDMLANVAAYPSLLTITNPFGAAQKPCPWIDKIVGDRTTIVVGDADEPGQNGANRWASTIAVSNKNVHLGLLPYPIDKKHGKDLRDFLRDGQSLSQLELVKVNSADPEVKQLAINLAGDDPRLLAQVCVKRYHEQNRRLIFHGETFYRWKGQVYEVVPNAKMERRILQVVSSEFERQYLSNETELDNPRPVTPQIVNSTLRHLAVQVEIKANLLLNTWISNDPESSDTYIAFENGILSIDALCNGNANCFYKHTPDWFSTIMLPYDFSAEADCSMWRRYLYDVMDGDHGRIRVLQQWAGYLLMFRKSHYQKMIMLQGTGGNGKSVYLAGIEAMLGDQNVSFVAMDQFKNEFFIGTMRNKFANIVGDSGNDKDLNERLLKGIIDGMKMSFDKKYGDIVTDSSVVKMMVACNDRPTFKDKTDAMWRRLIVVPFQKKIKQEERVYGMDKAEYWRSHGQVQGIFLWAVEGLKDLLENGFIVPKICEVAVEDYRDQHNPHLIFFRDKIIPSDDTAFLSSNEAYECYVDWSIKVKAGTLSQRKFVMLFNDHFSAYRSRVQRGGESLRGIQGWQLKRETIF